MEFRTHDTAIRLTHRARAALLADVAGRLSRGEGFALATLNLDHLVKLRRDAAFRAAYAAQDFVVADGNPVVWLSRLAGEKVELMPGSDLVEPLCRAATDAGLPVSMLGASEAALQGAAAALVARIPGFRTGALIAPPMGFDPEGEEARAALARLAATGPSLCLVALGAPRQERFAALGRRLAPQAGFASVGAGVEFLSGHQRRAPRWVRAMAMEWLWRALTAPGRLVPRYAACLAILPGEALEAWRRRRQRR